MKPDIEVNRRRNIFESYADLPEIVLYKIFGNLCSIDLARAGGVCSRWYDVSRYDTFWKFVDISDVDLTPCQVEKLLSFLPSCVSYMRIRCLNCPRKQLDPIFTAKNSAKLKENCPQLETLIIENALLTTYKSDTDFEAESLPQKVCVLSLRASIFRTDYFFSNINACVNIKVMDFSSCLCVRDHHLVCFCKMRNLEELYLAGCPIYDKGIMFLVDTSQHKSLLRLKVLDLEGTEVSDECLIVLHQMLPTLEKLYLGRTKITYDGFAYLDSSSFLLLHTLCLKNTTFNCEGVKLLSQLKSLKYIDLLSSDISGNCMPGIDAALKKKFRFKDDEAVNPLYCDHFLKRNANGY